MSNNSGFAIQSIHSDSEMSKISLNRCGVQIEEEGLKMQFLIGYQNSLCRLFIRDHLAASDVDIQMIVGGTLRECLQLAQEASQLNAVAIDLEMSDMDGIAGFRQMRDQLASTIPVALIGPICPLADIREYLAQGAQGYLPYSLGCDALLAAMRMIAAGETYVPVDLMSQSEEPPARRVSGWLTGRERDVLVGLLAGQSNKEIARDHGLSEVTIKHHLKSLRSKLGARNRTHAVCRAIGLGIAEEGQLVL